MEEQTLKDPQNPHGPVAIRATKIHVDKDMCIGAATCVAIAPHTFHLDSEAKAIILATADSDTDETILDAARSCPVAAIYIEDQNGQRIYPN